MKRQKEDSKTGFNLTWLTPLIKQLHLVISVLLELVVMRWDETWRPVLTATKTLCLKIIMVTVFARTILILGILATGSLTIMIMTSQSKVFVIWSQLEIVTTLQTIGVKMAIVHAQLIFTLETDIANSGRNSMWQSKQSYQISQLTKESSSEIW